MRVGALDPLGTDKWYVTDGSHSVGPVRLELLARGIEAGRVPLDSFLRHEAWKVWRPLTDFTDYVSEPRAVDSRQMARAAASASDDQPVPTHRPGQLPLADMSDRGTLETPNEPARAPSLVEFATSEGVASRSSFDSIPPPGGVAPLPSWTGDSDADEFLDGMDADLQTDVSRDLLQDDPLEIRAREGGPRGPSAPAQASRPFPALHESSIRPSYRPLTDDIPSAVGGTEHWGSARAADSSDALADDDLRGAADLSDALLLLMGAAVRRTKSEVALLHRVGDEGSTVVCAHGFGDSAQLGRTATFVDPMVVAAASGMLVLAEASPGPGGAAMIRRLGGTIGGKPVVGALMLPVLTPGVGGAKRLFGFLELGKTTSFTARELVKGEDLVAAFVRHVDERGFDLR